MGVSFFFSISTLLLLFTSSEAAIDFSCQDFTGGTGTFPQYQNTIVPFPKNYYCVINFAIRPGYVVKLTIATNVTDSNDSLQVQDTLGQPKVINKAVSLFVAPAPKASVQINSTSGTSQFWFRYEYVYMGLLEQVTYNTGQPFPLNIVPVKVYTIRSPKQQTITIHTESPSTSDDMHLLEIFVYDGPDVTNSPYVGTLYDIVNRKVMWRSSGTSFTLVNQYGTYSTSYALCNDYNEILQYGFYTFNVFNSKQPIARQFTNYNEGDQAHTFYSIDMPFSYITQMSMSQDTSHTLEITPQSPTNPLLAKLQYLSDDNIKQYMPQQIPGNMFTIATSAPLFKIDVESKGDSLVKWTTPRAGRFGTIFSPSLWTVGATPQYIYGFESPPILQYTFNIQSAVMASPGEQISVQIGSSGSAPFTTTFTHGVTNPGVRVANGTYMQVTYTGNNTKSSSIVTFEMEDPNGYVFTTPKMESTTKLSERISVFVVFMMVLRVLY